MRRKPIRKRRISPNPRRNFFCGFFVFFGIFYNFVAILWELYYNFLI